MARAYPYLTPSIDGHVLEHAPRLQPRARGLGFVVPYGAIASGAGAAGVLKPKLAKAAGGVAGAATGAKVGTTFGPIGTAIGAVLGAAASLLGGKKVAKAELYWDDWRKSAMGRIPGPQLDNTSFEEAFKGMWDTNNRDFPGFARYRNAREQFKADLAQQIVQAAVAGQLGAGDNAESIYGKVVAPWLATMKPGGIPPKRSDIRQLVVDLIDRYIHNLHIGRADMPEYRSGGYSPSIPLISAALDQAMPKAPSASAPTVAVPAPAVPPSVAPPAVPQPAPLPAQPTAADIEARVREIANSILATQAGQQLSADEVARAASATAFQWLQSQGVPTGSARVQTAVTDSAAATVGAQRAGWILPAALGIGGALVLVLVLRPRGSRRARS